MMTLDPGQVPGLTERQEQILARIGEGLTNREIGDQLGLAEQTVKNSVTELFAAIGVRGRVRAAVYAATVTAFDGPNATRHLKAPRGRHDHRPDEPPSVRALLNRSPPG